MNQLFSPIQNATAHLDLLVSNEVKKLYKCRELENISNTIKIQIDKLIDLSWHITKQDHYDKWINYTIKYTKSKCLIVKPVAQKFEI